MHHKEQWIWLPEALYGSAKHNIFSSFEGYKKENYIVAEFSKSYSFASEIISAELSFSGDAIFQLYCNNSVVATGPACVGGDFIGNETVRENFYAFETVIYPGSNELNFFARVQMMPVQTCDYSHGCGGFMLSAILTFEDGTKQVINTDDSWLVRKNGAYIDFDEFDSGIVADSFVNAECIDDVWNALTAEIPVRDENELFCENSKVTLNPNENKKVLLEFDKIWAGFIHVTSKAQGEIEAEILIRELTEEPRKVKVKFAGDGEYRGFFLHSAGNIEVAARNISDESAELTVSLIETHYPVTQEATTVTDDEELNLVLETCKHTLKICRQTHHLDSPKHCEPMACTGDYNIESLMTVFSFGDMRLAEFDLVRTAFMIVRENGRMFHTTYSLIWVRMLYDIYMFTGNMSLLEKCSDALKILLRCFETYVDENGIIDNPPDYMFVDWIYIDEISMHHPPKALGQTCLNMFYFGTLESAEKIFSELGMNDEAARCAEKREMLRSAVNEILFDKEKGIYFMGLNTPTAEEKLGWKWMPQNTQKRYYLKHANVLAACYGICDDETAKTLVKKIMADEIESECQPYFLHYLLEAVNRLGMNDEYVLDIIDKWKQPVSECSKGLVEGFIAPEPTYSFDHSHAWGGTPLFSLSRALIGLEIIAPGMKSIKLSPSLLGLESATVELPTPYGKLICEMKKGCEPVITCPKGIKLTLC